MTEGVPDAPHWHLSPLSMGGWDGLTIDALCRVLVDPSRNGGRDATALACHMAEDPLVAWPVAWPNRRWRRSCSAAHPREAFAALVKRWADAGAGYAP